MNEIIINNSCKTKVFIGNNVNLSDFIFGYNRILILSDTNVSKLYGNSVLKQLKKNNNIVLSFSINPGEKNKNIQTIVKITDFISENNLDGFVGFNGHRGSNIDAYTNYHISFSFGTSEEVIMSTLDLIFTNISPFLCNLNIREPSFWSSLPIADFNIYYQYRFTNTYYGWSEIKTRRYGWVQIGYEHFDNLVNVSSFQDFCNIASKTNGNFFDESFIFYEETSIH